MVKEKSCWEKYYGSEIVVGFGLAILILFLLKKSWLSLSIEVSLLLIAGIILVLVGLISSKHKCELMIILILAVSAILCCKIYFSVVPIEMKDRYLLVAIAGIAALIIPVILSISSDYNIGARLDSGEIRKSIVVSLTIIYIIFLVMSFGQTLNSQPVTGGKYLLNVTYDEKANNTSQKLIYFDVNSTSEGVLQVIPVTATVNVSNGTVQITPLLYQNTSPGNGGGGMIPLTSDNGTSLPADAISSFTKNFLWVYALIISFYFGSRILEDRTDRNNIKDYIQTLITNDADPIDIATKRYVLGDIGSREFKTMKCDLEGRPEVRIRGARAVTIDDAKYIILSVWNGTNSDIEVENVEINVIDYDKKIKASPTKKYEIKGRDHSLVIAKIDKDLEKLKDLKNITGIRIEAKLKDGKEKFSDQTTNIDVG